MRGMASVLQVLGGKPDATPAERDPVQREQGRLYLLNQRHPPPGGWSADRSAQSDHYKGMIFLALSAVQEAMAGCAVWSECRKRRDRTTFGPGGATAVVKGVAPDGGAGNDEDYAPERSSVIAEVIARPNDNETFPAMLGYATLQWGLTGNAPFWLVPGAGHGRPVELYPLVEALLQPAYGPSELYPEGAYRAMPYYAGGMGWAYGVLAQRFLATTLLPGTEVRKLRAPHPLTRTDGYSPLSGCAVQFDVMEAIDLSRHAAFMNGSQVGTMVYIPGLGQEAADAVAADYRQKYGGPANARKVGFLSSPPGNPGEFKVDRDPPPREMDYASSWEQATRVVLAAFGQHAATAGLKDSSAYSEIFAARMQVYYRLSGFARQWGDFWTTYLARPWSKRPGDYRVKVQLQKPRNEESYLTNLLSAGQQGVADVNELRAAFDLKPKVHGDLPCSVYLQKVQSEAMPQPQQPAGPDQQQQAGPGDPGATGAPKKPGGSTPGAPSLPRNPAGKGTLPPRPTVGKALRGDDLVAKVLSGLEES